MKIETEGANEEHITMSRLTDRQTPTRSVRSACFCAEMAIGEPRLEVGHSECECADPRALFCPERGSAACQSNGQSQVRSMPRSVFFSSSFLSIE